MSTFFSACLRSRLLLRANSTAFEMDIVLVPSANTLQKKNMKIRADQSFIFILLIVLKFPGLIGVLSPDNQWVYNRGPCKYIFSVPRCRNQGSGFSHSLLSIIR